MRLHFRTLLATFVAATAFVSAAHADQLADIKKKGEIVFGVLGTDEPNSFVDPKSARDRGLRSRHRQGDRPRRSASRPVFKQLAVAARIPELQQGRVDVLAASLTHNKERESQIDFSLTTFVTGQKVLVKTSSGIADVPQLAGKKVLTVKGGTQEPNIRKAVPNVDVVTFETTQQAFLALQQGKGVGYVNDEASLVNDYAKLGPAKKDYAIPARPTSAPNRWRWGMRKNEPALKGSDRRHAARTRDLRRRRQAVRRSGMARPPSCSSTSARSRSTATRSDRHERPRPAPRTPTSGMRGRAT